MNNLDAEQTRVLVKRIASAIYRAKYDPASVPSEQSAAYEVLKPYLPPEVRQVYEGNA